MRSLEERERERGRERVKRDRVTNGLTSVCLIGVEVGSLWEAPS